MSGICDIDIISGKALINQRNPQHNTKNNTENPKFINLTLTILLFKEF